MFLSTIIGLTFTVVAFGTLVAGDSPMIITIDKASIKNRENDYFGEWQVEIGQGKKSSVVTVNTPVKSELPNAMEFKLIMKMEEMDPIEKVWNICESFDDKSFGMEIGAVGLPKDTFPKACPIVAGDFIVSKYELPGNKLPPGCPTGRFIATGFVVLEDEEPFIELNFEGTISHSVPGF